MQYAPWIKRMLAQMIDMLVAIPFLFAFLVARELTSGGALIAIGIAALVTYLATTFLNRCVIMGRTGWSLGKMLLGIRIVDSRTGCPVGIKRLLDREFVHNVDIITGFGMMLPLFPSWDHKGQLFADKIMKTVVIEQPWERATRFDPAIPVGAPANLDADVDKLAEPVAAPASSASQSQPALTN